MAKQETKKEAETLQIHANNNNMIPIWEYTRKMRTNTKTKKPTLDKTKW